MKGLRVRQLMTEGVFFVRPADPISTVRDLMIDKRIRHVPVVDDDGELVGLVSERDLLRQVLAETEALPRALRTDLHESLRVSEIMTRDVETADVEDELARAAEAMYESKFGCLPVLDGGRLVGILTEADFVRYHYEGRRTKATR